MSWLRTLSLWQVLLVWPGWFALVTVGAFVALHIAEARARRSMPANQDYLVAIIAPELALVALLILGPPLLLTLLWLWQRFRGS